MKHIFFFLSILFAASPASAALSPAPTAAANSTATSQFTTSASLSRKAVETRLGRKLKFTERVGLSLARGKMKRSERKAVRKGMGKAPNDKFAAGSLFSGILGLALFVVLLPQFSALIVGVLLGLLAGVLGLIALRRFKRNPQFRSGKGLAITGLVLGGVMTLILLLFLVAIASGAGAS